jgi:hypothetical protein
MPTIVSKFGSSAENLDVGLLNSVAWFNVNEALTDNNTNAFSSFSIGNVQTQYLYIHGFGYALPTGAVIDGISVKTKKRAGGPIHDLGVYLVFEQNGALEFSPSNRALDDPWTSVYQTIEYGSDTDTWDVDWNNSKINNPAFGVALAAYGDGSLNNGPVIDYFEITIYYHQVFTHTPSGSVIVSGSVTPKGSTTHTPTGGVKCFGHGPLNYDEKGFSGASLGGTAPYESSYYTTGGTLVGGSADVHCTYLGNSPHPFFYSFYCLGSHDVPPDNNHPDKMALVWFDLDPGTRFVTWNIDHNLESADRVYYMGPAEEDQVGTIHYSISDHQDTTSPIFGSVRITPNEVQATLDGLAYLWLKDDSSNTRLRGHIKNVSLKASGSADVNGGYAINASGSLLCSGSASKLFKFNHTPQGGLYIAGDSHSFVEEDVSGEAYVGGSANVTLVLVPQGSTSGARCGGSGTVVFSLNISPTSGVICNGTAIRSLIVPIQSAGLYANGSGRDDKVIPVDVVAGTFKASGTHVQKLIFAPLPVVGGIKIFGSWPGEKIKFFVTQKHINYALLMKNKNILNTPAAPKNVIMDRFKVDTPLVTPNPFNVRNQPGWCDFGEACKAAYLPKVVQNRQGKYLPTKKGGVTIGNDQITTFD